MVADRLLDGLNQAQLEAVTAPAGRLVVVAGAGSGKTRVLTRRIAWRVTRGETDPNRVLALTFTRRAGAELRQRQRRLGLRDTVPAGTFHSFALSQLRQRWAEKRTVPPTLINSKVRLLSQICRAPAGVAMVDVAAEIEWARARLVQPDDYPVAAAGAGRTPPADAEFIVEAMAVYQREKRRKRLVDFDDLLALAVRDLQADPDYAEAVRWRHRHFYVDEFQDVNPLQYQLLTEWLGGRDDLFLVGDPRQAIYGWNGADPGLMHRLMADGDTTTIELRYNYRSTPQVLGLANAALNTPGFVADGAPAPSWAGSSAAANNASRLGPLEGHKPDGPAPVLRHYENDRAEAAGVAEAVRSANAAGHRYRQQAVLVRTNAQLALIEQELAAVGIPSQVRSGAGPLGSPEVKQVLRSIARDGIDLVKQLEELDVHLEETADDVAPSAVERHSNLAALSRLIHEFLIMDPAPSGPGFLAWLNTLAGGDVDRGDDAVDLVTFHGAKGLEWPVVHVAGLEDGFVPIVYAETVDQLAEEQRLLYVALTRAEEHLNLSWAQQRMFGTKTVGRQPSPIVEVLAAEIEQLGGTALAPDWRAHIARSRQAIDSSISPDAAVDPAERVKKTYDELVRWRARKARAGQVPPHVIVSDQILRLVAEHRPSTIGQLATVTDLRPAKLTRFGQDLLDTVHQVASHRVPGLGGPDDGAGPRRSTRGDQPMS
ncbi:MAG: ATP-dependent DNA helicase UvrD2 [Acidimicrobiia bacterium]|nr:ATP-dependent DNA helicase UvrD2 [Acidimicrobiia bacterium]